MLCSLDRVSMSTERAVESREMGVDGKKGGRERRKERGRRVRGDKGRGRN